MEENTFCIMGVRYQPNAYANVTIRKVNAVPRGISLA